MDMEMTRETLEAAIDRMTMEIDRLYSEIVPLENDRDILMDRLELLDRESAVA